LHRRVENKKQDYRKKETKKAELFDPALLFEN
jgi:hypothetical protein